LLNKMSLGPEKSNLDNCDFWCETDGDKIEKGVGTNKTKFVWRVKNFNARQEQKGESIHSESFTVVSSTDVATKWKLELYPNGCSSAKEGYLSVFLLIQETKAKARYKISISDEHGQDMETLASSKANGTKFHPNPKGGSWGRHNALSIDELKENWLFDDVLTLVCEVSVMEVSYENKHNHRLQMMEDLGKAYKNKNSLDVTVRCGDASFECNKFMLTARSPVFKAMFQHDTKESQTNVVEVKDIKPKVLKELLDYIHKGDAPKMEDYAKELLVAADFYQLDQLKISCQELLSETLNAENSIEILILSDVHSAPKLREAAIKFVTEYLSSSSINWKEKLADHPSIWSEIVEPLLTKNGKLKDDLKRSAS